MLSGEASPVVQRRRLDATRREDFFRDLDALATARLGTALGTGVRAISKAAR